MRPPKEEVLHGAKRVVVTLPVLLVTLIGIMPQIVVIVSSFIKCDFTGFKKGFSIDSYVTIFKPSVDEYPQYLCVLIGCHCIYYSF